MRFRPCIDIHKGRVKQLVGSTLSDNNDNATVNFSTARPPSYFASMYKKDNLSGGHVIMLGSGNREACLDALQAFPGGMQAGGGITTDNAAFFLDKGAAKVIVTSVLFKQSQLDFSILDSFKQKIGADKLVIDLSCRKKGEKYFAAINRWQVLTTCEINPYNMKKLAAYCSEFLIHSVEHEGKQNGIDTDLIKILARSPLPVVYAGGIYSMEQINTIAGLSRGKVDFTVGSALDIFGGHYLRYKDMLKYR